MGKYAVAVMVISFFVDLLLLEGAGRMSEQRIRLFGPVTAALLGAAYKGLCVISGMEILNYISLRIFVCAVMGLVVFGFRASAVRPTMLFVVLQMALSGIAAGVGKGCTWAILTGGIALWLVCALAYPEGGQRIVPLELTNQGNTVSIRALIDTGNMLRDPVSGERVLVVCGKLGKTLAGLTEAQIADPVRTLAAAPRQGMRLIPYHTVGNDGLMLGMRIEQVKIKGKNGSGIVAFAPKGLGSCKEYQALAGGIG